MAEITRLAIQADLLSKEIFVSREVRDVPAMERFGQSTAGYREYAASSSEQPAFVIRVEALKNAPKPSKRQKILLFEPELTYITERNANRRAIDIPIIVAKAVQFVD